MARSPRPRNIYPTSIACGLKIAGLSRLAVVGLSDRYKKTQVYDAAEYYAPDDNYAGYEDDNNER